MSDWSHQVEAYLRFERNEHFRAQVERLKRDNEKDELKRLFGRRLTFGTAGIRGAMGPGFSQMNDLVIIQTSQGLVSYLLETYGESLCRKRGVIIGHDARHNSARFARLAALAFLQKLIPVYFCEQIVATPLVAFGVSYFNCYCGIVVTASHNPKQDNGYKVYWSNGAQILSPHDANIQRHIQHQDNQRPWSDEFSYAHELLGARPTAALVSSSQSLEQVSSLQQQQQQQLPSSMADQLHRVYDDLCRSYFAFIQRLVAEQYTLNQQAPLTITYTTMHGVGHEFVTRALEIAGFERLHPVEAQMKPDPEFPTVKFPNPEEAGALDLAFETAAQTESTLILANDPDADRCAAALYCPTTKRRRVLTGNEIGQLLGWWLWHLNQTRTSASAAGLTRHHQSRSSTSSDTIAGAMNPSHLASGSRLGSATPKYDDDDDQELDIEYTADKTPATPITKPVIGTGCVQVVASGRKSSFGTRVGQRASTQRSPSPHSSRSRSSLSSGGGRLCKADDCFMLSTAVSSRFLQTMARHEGFRFVETLTGFKYMGNVAHELLKRGKTTLFAYEEALGYMCDSQILDKDGISAAVQLAQCAAYLMSTHNRTLEAQLDWLHLKYGYHFSLNSYFLCHEQRTIRAIFHELQSNYPRSFKSQDASTDDEQFVVSRVRDLNNGIDNGTPDHKPDLPTSTSSFMVTFWIGDEIRFTIRTSGTEPKIKYYSEIVTPLKAAESEPLALAAEKQAARQRLERFVNAAIERCIRPSFYKLEPAAAS